MEPVGVMIPQDVRCQRLSEMSCLSLSVYVKGSVMACLGLGHGGLAWILIGFVLLALQLATVDHLCTLC